MSAVAPQLDNIREILVIQVSRIGDTLLSTPTIQAIAKQWPYARLTCLGHPKRIEILQNLPFISRVGGISKQSAPWMGWLPGKPYDLAFVFGRDKPLVAYALRIAKRVVSLEQGDQRLDRSLFHAAHEPAFQSRHAVLMQYALIEDLGIPLHERQLCYRVTAEENAWAEQQIHRCAPAAWPLIGLQVASFPTKGYRDWPVESFSALAKKIRSHYPNAHFLIFGGKLEQERTNQLAQDLAAAATHFAGRLSLRQTAALMSRLDYYIGVDTGPTHIMGALQRPMLAFYHPYSPSPNLAPLDHPNLTVIDHPLAGQVGPEASMAGITVDTVWQALAPALAKLSPPGGKAH